MSEYRPIGAASAVGDAVMFVSVFIAGGTACNGSIVAASSIGISSPAAALMSSKNGP